MPCKLALVVDDDVDIRMNLKEALEIEGIPAVTASNGQEALSLLTTGTVRPDVIILDLMMPVMDGKTFLQTLHQREHAYDLGKIPVLVVTASRGEVLRELPPHAGALLKPLDLDELFQLIDNVCKPTK